MKKAILALASLTFGTSCGDASSPKRASAEVRAYCGERADEVEQRIDRFLSRMTTAEKVALAAGGRATRPWGVPGNEELGIRELMMIDGPRGVASRTIVATAFPVGIARGATFSPELEVRVGTAIGGEVRASGRNVLLAPTVNVLSHPRWGRAQETYGEDPHHLGIMGTAFVRGAQTQVAAMVKHFAVNNIENTRREVDVTIDERTLHEVYLPQFRRIVTEGRVASVMSSYNSVNGEYAFENAALLRDTLRERWGFAGAVVSDWGSTKANTETADHTARAAAAGLDIEMFAPLIYGRELTRAVTTGRVDEQTLDAMTRRNLRMRLCDFYADEVAAEDPSKLNSPSSHALAREVAERSIVLLRNEGALLPIARTAGKRIVVTGPFADVANIGDTGSSSVKAEGVVTPYAGLLANAGAATITLAPTTTAPEDVDAITNADVVIVVAGLSAADEGEADLSAGDRSSLALPSESLDAITNALALSTKVVVVLEGGSAVTMDGFAEDAEAILHAWYPGSEGGHAIARVLFGEVNPSGRLPLAFPAADADLPPFDNVSHAVTYGYLHGYRHLDANNTTPLFPFGFGLSYTTFAYGELEATKTNVDGVPYVHLELDVENTGTVAGRETVQLYVARPSSAVVPRAPRDLRAFTQVDLEPGQRARVSLDVKVSELGYWNTEVHDFVVEQTTYRFEVGSSSRDLPRSIELPLGP